MTINSEPNPKLERANTLSLQERDLLLSFDGEFKKILKAGFYFVETGPPDSVSVQQTRALDFLNMVDKLELPWNNTCVVVKEFTPLLEAFADRIEDFSEQFISQLADFSDKVTEQNCIFIFPVTPRPHLMFFRSISTKWKQQANGSDIRVNFVFPSLEKNGVFIGDISEEIKEKLRKTKLEKEKKKPRRDDKKRRFGFKRPPKSNYSSKKPKNRSTKQRPSKSGDRYYDRSPYNYKNRNTGEKKKRRRRRKRPKPQGTNNSPKKPHNTSPNSKKNK